MNKHQAYTIEYLHLIEGLEAGVAEGNISVRSNGPFKQYTYTQKCVMDKAWDLYTESARGLIVDTHHGQIAAAPFPKFFNFDERPIRLPDEPFRAFDKIDGSLIIQYRDRYAEAWAFATKGSFNSDQALMAKKMYEKDPIQLNPLYTYLWEITYPENRIVVDYRGQSNLWLLGAYNVETGEEILTDNLLPPGRLPDIYRIVPMRDFSSIEEILEYGKGIKGTDAEGIVIRYPNGLRLKIKFDEYLRLHKLVSRITPLAIWEMIAAGDNLEAAKMQIPEEFHSDFNTIYALISRQIDIGMMDAIKFYEANKDLPQKDYALLLQMTLIDGGAKSVAFSLKSGTPIERCRRALAKRYRPTANKLEGYVPSRNIVRFATDEEL